MLGSLFCRGWRLNKAPLVEDTGALPNPAAGWYHIYAFPLEVPAEKLEQQWQLEPGEQLALLLLDLGAFRQRELDEETLDNLKRGLDYFCRSGKELILRGVYDRVGRGAQSEPAQFDRVVQHLTQLVHALQPYQSHIFVYQGMLLGSWGEMHSSRFLTKPRMKTLLAILEQLDGPFLAVRRPVFYRMLRKESAERKLGLFDDAILASETDMGTFGWERREVMGWEAPWLPEEELAFEEALCSHVPQGGEALLPQNGGIPLQQAAAMLQKMNITYLNSQYDPALLSLWREQQWTGGLWDGISGFDYIGRHLGYRFCLRETALRREKGRLDVSVTVENVGFAPIYQSCELLLIQVTLAGEEFRISMSGSLLGLKRGARVLTAKGIRQEKSLLYVHLCRVSDGREIIFATRSPQQQPNTRGLFLGTLE